MRAIVIEKYGAAADVLLYKTDIPTPTIADNEVLIEVHASALNPVDCAARAGYGQNIFKTMWGELPLVLGRDAAGVIVQVGKNVAGFKCGDEVYAAPHIGCHAEYVAVDASYIAKKPRNLSYLEAASLPFVALTAWTALVDNAGFSAENAAGKKVVIPRAAGGVGSFAVQLMKAWGAYVVGLCSERNFDFVRALGADEVIDYTKADFSAQLTAFDCAFDTVGRSSDFESADLRGATDPAGEHFDEKLMSMLKRDSGAAYVTVCSPKMALTDRHGLDEGIERARVIFEERSAAQEKLGRRYYWSFCNPSGAALTEISQLLEQGKILPLIDKVYRLEHMVAAHEYCESKQAQGKIAIDIREDGKP
ncbi:zinc-binding dehydrogenase [Woeseia oceani]|uniref:Enoyl reductase (ER) domain-containing protein n=1 Tax=Woeseia oceani TaxID=1548547 RepID=A0A193LDG2_9GAMM|nr:zinc-binding dehydrogenase [Woeseia oceani]ANO50518.1 hypothetical protein BA177_04195 [Woeseia oceani]